MRHPLPPQQYLNPGKGLKWLNNFYLIVCNVQNRGNYGTAANHDSDDMVPVKEPVGENNITHSFGSIYPIMRVSGSWRAKQ